MAGDGADGFDDTASPAFAPTLADSGGSSASAELVAGTAVGRYVIERRLGAGGMGVVYAARDPELGRSVAIKLLHADAPDQDELLVEGRATAKLRHPNVVTIYDVGRHEDRLFIAMELVSGGTLRAWLEKPHRPRDVLAAFLGAGAGLAAAHAAGLVHRDFKPDNVLVDGDGRVLVTDFGLAHATGGVASGESVTDLTRRGEVVGTPAYMSPEQYAGEVVDARSDLFSFCVALAEALQGSRPFVGDTFGELREAVTRGEPKLRLPGRIERAVRRGLARDREQRTPTMAALLAQLEPRRRAPWIAAGVALAAAATVAFTMPRSTVPSTDVCDANAAVIETSWTEAAREAIRRRAPKYGDEDIASFEVFRESWKQLHHQACTRGLDDATRALGEQELGCLDRARGDYERALLAKPFGVMSDPRPAIPYLSRCAGEHPAREVTEVGLGDWQSTVFGIALSPDAKEIALSGDGLVEIMPVTGGGLRKLPIEWPYFIAWPDDALVVLAKPGAVRVRSSDGVATTFAAHRAEGELAISPQGDRTLVRGADGRVEIMDLQRGQRTPLSIHAAELYGPIAWSRSDQLAFPIQRGATNEPLFAIVDLRSGRTVEVPIRATSQIGTVRGAWLDDQTLIFNGQVDSEHGASLWAAPVRDGRLAGPIGLIKMAPHGTIELVYDVRGGRAVSLRTTAHRDLLSVEGGKASPILAMFEVKTVNDVDARGERLAIARDGDSGLLAISSGAYEKLADAPVNITFDGEQPVVGSAADYVRAPTHCAPRAPGHCVWSDPTAPGIRLRAGTRTLIDRPDLDGRMVDFGVSPDGRRVAFSAGGEQLVVVDIATGHQAVWAEPDADCPMIQRVAWSRKSPDVVYFTALCRNVVARVFRAEHGKPHIEVYAPDAYISNFAVGPNDQFFVAQRKFNASLVVIDGL